LHCRDAAFQLDCLPIRAFLAISYDHCYHLEVRYRKVFSSQTVLAIATAVSLVVVADTLPAANLPPVPNTVISITPEELRMHLQFLASDELGGRYTLAPNFAISARYLASHLEAYGFRGAGEQGSFLQKFEVVATQLDPSKTSLELTLEGKSATYAFGDFLPMSIASAANVHGQIVFVGAGISSPGQKHDDYAALDVKGKIVLLASAPQFTAAPGVDTSKLAENEHGEGAARAHGAVAVLQAPSQRMAGQMVNKTFQDRFAMREAVRLEKSVGDRLPVLTLGPELADKLFSAAGLSLKGVQEAATRKKALQPKALDAAAHILVAAQQKHVSTENVAGILEGTDPRLKNQYVMFSAHYDHLQTSDKGEVYHGADDDGSGTSALLAIAHAMALDRPKRSVLVMFHAGEELGLLGSEYNTDYAPVVPLDRVVADLNMDMIGRSKPAGDNDVEDEHLSDANTIYLVGSDRISHELHELSEETNSQFQRMKLDYYYNDRSNPERIYFRSDHWNYAKHGIPVIFYFDGVHADYHQPTDTVDKIDFSKMTRVARLVFETGWRIANLDHRLAKTQRGN
jgi:Zn-dependent M28 family amino/carboxypeptidase